MLVSSMIVEPVCNEFHDSKPVCNEFHDSRTSMVMSFMIVELVF